MANRQTEEQEALDDAMEAWSMKHPVVVLVNNCWLCKEKFAVKDLVRIGNRPLCWECGFTVVKFLDNANANASEIGKVASCAYLSEDDKDRALEGCVAVSSAMYLDGWTPASYETGWNVNTQDRENLISALESISGATNVDYAIRRANEALAEAGVDGYAHAAAVAQEPDGNELRPCPFCGGKMSITEDAGGPFRDHNKVAFIAGCDNEGCDLQFPGCDTKKLAIEIANRRA